MKTAMRQRGRERGMTLLEVLAAMLIMAIAIFALMDLQAMALRNTVDTKLLARAHAAAETAMDTFLAVPRFEPFGEVFDSAESVEVPPYTDQDFEVKRILSEYVPLEDQESIDIFPAEEDDTAAEGDDEEEEEPFDPGVFLSVRIEVWTARGHPRLLVTLETWLPKPPWPVEEEEESSAAPQARQLVAGRDAAGIGGAR